MSSIDLFLDTAWEGAEVIGTMRKSNEIIELFGVRARNAIGKK